MAKKKEKKNVTIDELAVMVNNGFESLKKEFRSELRSEIGSVRDELRGELHSEIGGLREEMHQGFKMVTGAVERITRRTDIMMMRFLKSKAG